MQNEWFISDPDPAPDKTQELGEVPERLFISDPDPAPDKTRKLG
jgi:hypothetical protein